MKTNRFLGFIMSVAALAFAATACDDKKEDLGAPSVEVEKSEISFEKTGGTETVQVTPPGTGRPLPSRTGSPSDRGRGKAPRRP